MAMCFLVQQLRLEKKVDICSVVRKLRSQRMGMLEKYVSGVFFKLTYLWRRLLFILFIFLFFFDSRLSTNSCTERS